jgi:hypothetical protein
MSFDVHLLASTSSPPPGAFEAKVDAVLRALGAEGGVAEEGLRTHDGLEAELYAAGGGGAMFALRGFSPSMAEAIFAVADATSCFILSAAEVATPLRTPANAGDLAMNPEEAAEFPPPLPIADAAALMAIMAGDFDGWSRYRDQIQAAPKPKKSWLGRLFSRS